MCQRIKTCALCDGQFKISIREFGRAELTDALPLIWEVFLQYEAPQYTESGKQAFWSAIHDKGYLNQLRAYGAFDGDALVGIIATRSNGQHLALFFVKGTYQGKGIGRALWDKVLSESTAQTITVHSSNYAVPIYEKLGFVKTAEMQTEGGIAYIPMEYHLLEIFITENVSLKEIYEYMKALSYPYHYETGYDLWEKSYLRDVDGEGRILFHNLTTIGAYQDDKIVGFLQYGKSAFGFDEKGEISEDVSYMIIRNFYYDKTCEEAGRKLLDEALRRMNASHVGTVNAFFHYFGMSCYARHGKLFEGFEYIDKLLGKTGFCVEHENVFYSCKLDSEDLVESCVKCNWHNKTASGQQYCDFLMGSRAVGGCEVHFLEQKNIAYLRWIFTNEDVRGKGIGSSCMAALKAELLKKGMVRLDTDTAVHNLVAQHFYEKNHFEKEGLTRSYYRK